MILLRVIVLHVVSLISCHRKYSQSECREVVVYSTVLHPTFLSIAAVCCINCAENCIFYGRLLNIYATLSCDIPWNIPLVFPWHTHSRTYTSRVCTKKIQVTPWLLGSVLRDNGICAMIQFVVELQHQLWRYRPNSRSAGPDAVAASGSCAWLCPLPIAVLSTSRLSERMPSRSFSHFLRLLERCSSPPVSFADVLVYYSKTLQND